MLSSLLGVTECATTLASQPKRVRVRGASKRDAPPFIGMMKGSVLAYENRLETAAPPSGLSRAALILLDVHVLVWAIDSDRCGTCA